jgi:hypothetical protein
MDYLICNIFINLPYRKKDSVSLEEESKMMSCVDFLTMHPIIVMGLWILAQFTR